MRRGAHGGCYSRKIIGTVVVTTEATGPNWTDQAMVQARKEWESKHRGRFVFEYVPAS